MSNNTIGDSRSGVVQQSRLNDINAEDIESMQILKGASAAAVWGSRAANGVLVITTKKGGRDNKLNINYSSSASFDKVNLLHPLQDKYGQGSNNLYNPTSQYSWGDKIADRSGGEDEVNKNAGRFESYNGGVFYPIVKKNSKEVFNQQREDAVFRIGTFYENNLNLSGGNDKGSFYLSLGDLRQKGIYSGQSDYTRNSVRFNTSKKFNDIVQASANANYIKTAASRIPKGDNVSALYIGMLRSSPDFNSQHWKGDYYTSPTASAITNRQRSYRNYLGASLNPSYNDPLWTIHEITNVTDLERFLISSEIVVSPMDWFSLTTRGGIDTYNDKRVTINPMSSASSSGLGDYEQQIIKETELNLDVIGRATKDLTPSLTSSLIVGFNVNDRRYNSLGGTMNNYILQDAPPNFSNSIFSNNSPYNSESHRRTARFYSTVNLGYREALFLNASIAGESGSTFGSQSKSTFYYPSGDIAWLFSELEGIKGGVLSLGKIRGSYGIVGIQPNPYKNSTPYLTASFSSWATNLTGGGYGGAYVQSGTQGDPFLKPERKTEWELGFDLRFFRNRLSVGYTYYRNKIEDLLLEVAVAGSTGFSRKYTNAGAMENKGMEFDLNYTVIRKDDLEWNIMANWSRNENKVTNLGGTDVIAYNSGALASVAAVGYPLSAHYGGVYKLKENGERDLTPNGFPQLGTVLGIIGDPNPDWRGGLGTGISFKKFSLNFLLETFQGADFYEGTRATLLNFGTHAEVGNEVTLTKDMYNYAGTLIPAGSTVRGNFKDYGAGPVLLDQSFYTTIGGHSGQLGEQFISDGSWTRIREITLGYSFSSAKFKEKTKLQSVNFSLTARNPFLWTKIDGIDPETNLSGVGNARGVDYFNNPSTKSLVLKLSVNY